MTRDYIAGKRNALNAKRSKILWYQEMIESYGRKAKAMEMQAKEDEKVLKELETLTAQRNDQAALIESLKVRLSSPGLAVKVDTILAQMDESKELILMLDGKIRALYYGK